MASDANEGRPVVGNTAADHRQRLSFWRFRPPHPLARRVLGFAGASFEYLLIPVGLGLFLLVWDLVTRASDIPNFVLPDPASVWRRFQEVAAGGQLWWHAGYTLAGALLGFAYGLALATVLGYGLGKSERLERLLSPYIVAGKSVPVLGIAPVFIIWFGMGLTSRAVIAFLIVFFPMLIHTIVGIRSVRAEQRELMRSYSASAWQVFARLEVPAALPILMGGIRIGVARSMMGAIVAEYLGGERGLGFLVNMGTGLTDAPLVFTAIFSIVAVTLALYGMAAGIEAFVLAQRR